MGVIFLDGLISPYPPFSFPLFIFFECITIFIEMVVLWTFGDRWLRVVFDKEKELKFIGFWDAFLLSIVINLFSAVLLLPVWMGLRVGV